MCVGFLKDEQGVHQVRGEDDEKDRAVDIPSSKYLVNVAVNTV